MLVVVRRCAKKVGVYEHLGLSLEIYFGVDVGGVDGDVSEPRTDGVDVDSGAQQMRGGCVPDGVRADRPAK